MHCRKTDNSRHLRHECVDGVHSPVVSSQGEVLPQLQLEGLHITGRVVLKVCDHIGRLTGHVHILLELAANSAGALGDAAAHGNTLDVLDELLDLWEAKREVGDGACGKRGWSLTSRYQMQTAKSGESRGDDTFALGPTRQNILLCFFIQW